MHEKATVYLGFHVCKSTRLPPSISFVSSVQYSNLSTDDTYSFLMELQKSSTIVLGEPETTYITSSDSQGPPIRPKSPWGRLDPYDSSEVTQPRSMLKRSLLVVLLSLPTRYVTFTAGPGQGVCGLCHSAQPSTQEVSEERF